MEFGSRHGGDVGEYECVGFLEIFKIFLIQDAFFSKKEPSEGVYK